MPSEEVMYLTILSNSALTQQKLSLEQSLHAYTKKETIFFFIKLSHGHKMVQIFFLLPMFQILAAHLLVLAVFQVT